MPTVGRRLRLTRKQWVGLPILAVVVALAVCGAFGDRTATSRARSREVELTVRYPERTRYRVLEPFSVVMRNISGRTLDTVVLVFDTAYVSRFAGVRIEPALQSAFAGVFATVRPGEARVVRGELTGDDYGIHAGRIAAVVDGETTAVAVRTVVFP